MRNLFLATALGASLCAAPLQPAKAWGGGGVFVGTVAGLAAGTIIGTAIARPYYPYPYPYPYAYAYPFYGYPAFYPAPVVAVPAYPAPAYVPSAYPAAPPPPASSAGRSTAPTLPSCGKGRFFNTYTGTCDIR